MLVNAVQESNTPLLGQPGGVVVPIVFRFEFDSNNTFSSLVQSLYLQPIVTQYLVCNKSEIWP